MKRRDLLKRIAKAADSKDIEWVLVRTRGGHDIYRLGQSVQVSARGEGFAIQNTGKALNNAAVNDALQVRMDSGQIVNGRLMADGSVQVML